MMGYPRDSFRLVFLDTVMTFTFSDGGFRFLIFCLVGLLAWLLPATCFGQGFEELGYGWR